jgi:5-methylcytosine-specific restriction endonuclease McrA
MADTDYARLLPGGLGLAALLPQKRGRGRPLGSKATKPQKTREAKYELACAGCGQAFKAKLPNARFCCSKCRNRASNRAGQERRRNSKPRQCRWCGVVYVPEYGSLRTHYCTTECRDEARRRMRSGSTHRKRAAKFGCAYEAVSKRKVCERDGWRCYLCGVDTPKELSGTDEPNAPELEHVVPLSAGGAHSYENVRCACRRCNRVKGGKTIGEAGIVALAGSSYVAGA